MMKSSSAWIAAMLLVLIPVTRVGADEPPTFGETTTVVAVEIAVNVVKDNLPVRGLRPENFEVFERRQPRELSGFEVIDLRLAGATPQVAATEEVSIAGRRHFLLLFDLSFTRQRSLCLATQAARELVHSGLHPTDLVGVAVFGVTSGAEILLGFTPDRRQVDKVLDALDRLLNRDLPPPPETRSPAEVDTLRLVALTYRDLVVQFGRTAGVEVSPAWEALEWGVFDGLGGGPLAETLFEMDGDQRQGIRERRRSAVFQLALSLGDLTRLTSGIDGRKFLVYFSEGFDSSLLYDEGGARTLRTLREMIDQIRRAGWTVQSVDPSGLREDERPFDNVESLLVVAKDTGGELYQNFNDLGSAMEGMLEKTSVTYLLSFHVADIESDGSFHPLRIALRDGPPGARLLYRPGYYAPKPLAEREELESVVETAELILGGREGGEIDASALVAPFKGPETGSGIPIAVWIEADGRDLLAEHRGETMEVDVYGYALDTDEEIHDFFSQKMKLDLGQARENLEQGGLKFYSELDLQPGRYALRVLVRAAETGRYALRIVPVSVADLSDSDPVLLPPVFVDALRRSVVVRESMVGARTRPYPFKIGEKPFVPVVGSALAPDQEARICVMAYHLNQGNMLLDASVVRPDGSQVEGDRLLIRGQSEVTSDGLSQLYLSFDPQGLEPGEYTLEVGITDRETHTTYSASRPFRLAEQGS